VVDYFELGNEYSDSIRRAKSDWGTLVPRINVENVYITK
jgi:uncharacterized protein (DUF1919 family)